MIRVGRIVNGKNPSFEGFENIVVMTKSSKYGSLSPYCLKYKEKIIENIWQFSKIYKKVPKSIQRYSRFDNTVIWDHKEETHIDENDIILPEYFDWRKKGMNSEYPIRYPVGFKYKNTVEYSMYNKKMSCDSEEKYKKLDYIKARKKIYIPIYEKSVVKEKQFKQLLKKLKNNQNLLIIEVDGPHQENLNYYKEKYKVSDDFIQNDTILMNKENNKILLNDTKHPYGHGYCLAMILLKCLDESEI